jgi:hypothetical protein
MVQWQNARTWNLHLGQRGQVSVVDVVAMQVWQVEGEHRPVREKGGAVAGRLTYRCSGRTVCAHAVTED